LSHFGFWPFRIGPFPLVHPIPLFGPFVPLVSARFSCEKAPLKVHLLFANRIRTETFCTPPTLCRSAQMLALGSESRSVVK
jgi:hypothetical protein